MRGHLTHRYLIALGGNIRHHRHGNPRKVLAAAMADMAALGTVATMSRIIESAPLGPSRRRYANGAIVLESTLEPEPLLDALQRIERDYGTRRGRRWAARVLDLDIVLWSGGRFASRCLTIPHPVFRSRRFVLDPAQAIAPGWRDPVTGRTLTQLATTLRKARRRAGTSDL